MTPDTVTPATASANANANATETAATVTVRELMLAGAHLGHRARFWHPRMAEYIFGKYQQIHVINLDHTVLALRAAADFLRAVAAGGGIVLYLGTKSSASEIVQRRATEAGMPYVSERWLGGMLTNFKTTRDSVARLIRCEEDIREGVLRRLTKKEGLRLMNKKEKLAKSIGGIRAMENLPEALFVIDVGVHSGAVKEANKLGIPVVAVVDTNHSPEGVDYVIPGNDDSRQAVEIYANIATDAITAGREEHLARARTEIRVASGRDDELGAPGGL